MALRIGTHGNDTLTGTVGNDVLIGDPQRSAILVAASSDSAGNLGNGTSDAPSFSPDGNAVVFVSSSGNFFPNDSNASYNVYLKDLLTGEVSKVSTTSIGGFAAGTSDRAYFSPNGQSVVFQSDAANLVDGDTNGKIDLFEKNLVTGAVTRLTTSSSGDQANGESDFFDFSPDGTKIIFDSKATNLVIGDTNSATDLFVKDLTSGAVTRVSTSSSGAQADQSSLHGSFSPDGGRIVFESYASNLVAGHLPGEDIYLKDLATGAITEISTNAAGESANGNCSNAVFSPDGTKVAFESSATNLVSGVPSAGETRLYIKDLNTGSVILASSDASGQPLPGICFGGAFSPDGKQVMVTSNFAGSSQSYIKNILTGTLQSIANPLGAGPVHGFEFSPDGSGYSFYAYSGGRAQCFVQITADLGAGADSLNGGDGDDIVSYETAKAAVTVDLRDTTGLSNTGDAFGDTYTSIEYFFLSQFADTFIGSSGDDTVSGSGGGDNIDGGGGVEDYVIYDYSNAGVTVNLALGTGTGGYAQGDHYTNIENVGGSDYADFLTGNSGNNRLDGWYGSDVLTGGDGNDIYYVDITTDSVIETNTNSATGGVDRVKFQGISGTYLLTANVEELELLGVSAINATGNGLANTMLGNAAVNILMGDAGDDMISGGSGGDTLDGGANTAAGDTLNYEGSSSGVSINLTANTTSGGDAEGDVISNFENVTGSSFGDQLDGTASVNTLRGSGGDDNISGGAGGDTLDGGANAASGDTVNYASSSAGVSINLATSSALGGDAQGDVISNFENVTGSSQGDQLVGDGGANVLRGLAGNDLFVGGLGADQMIGGADIDVVDYSGFATGVSINLTAGTGVGGDTLSDIENITGSAFGDVLQGDNGANTLRGGGGNDYMIAGNGADLMVGGADNDVVSYETATTGVFVNLSTGTGANGGVLQEIENITGSAFGDVLQGDNGANTIRGGAGNDYIIAGNGADLLIGGADNDMVSYETATTGVFANLATGIGANGGVLQDIENLTGSAFGDVLIGSALGNTLKGGAGNDYLVGNSGSDALYGGADNDIFRFESTTFGNDVIVDYQDNSDHISFAAVVATSFSQLTIFGNTTTSVTVQIAGQSIVVQGVANISLTASDFLFV